MPDRITPQRVHEQLDPNFFTDYARFSGAMRHYVSKTLEDSFKQDPNEIHRQLYIIGLYKEEYAAYEDMGAIVEAFIRWKLGNFRYPVEGILQYKVSQVVLETLFNKRKVKSPESLYNALGLEAWITPNWSSTYPGIDCKKVMKTMCRFIFIDCRNNQKEYGIEAYNRIKHGLAVVPYGKRYKKALPDSPAVITRNPKPQSRDPYILWGLPMTDKALNDRATVVEFVQSTLRALAAFYVIARYPDFLANQLKISPPETLFNLPTLSDVKGFIQQASDKS